jgi:hypothetical protein
VYGNREKSAKVNLGDDDDDDDGRDIDFTFFCIYQVFEKRGVSQPA